MQRREFLSGVSACAVALLSGAPASGEAQVEARLSIGFDAAGTAIPPDFTGLSYESAVLAYADYFNPDNRSVLGLLQRLGTRGVLRLGGNTTERTFWMPANDTHPPHDSYVIRPEAIDRLAGFLRALGWQLIYGLNLARGTPASAAEEAVYVANAVGPQLLAFQISNEPDGFPLWSAVRAKGYDAAAFLSEWRAFYDAIRVRLPDARFAGPAIAFAMDWIPPFVEAGRDRLVLLTRHYYSDGPARAPHISLPKLLRSAHQVEPILADMAALGQRYGLPFRIAETNSIFAEGHPGVSNTFASALWGLELMFQVAEGGGAGINFHTGDAKFYTPIGPAENGRHNARPLYYGMLMFAEACRGSVALLPVRLDASGVNLAAYATRAADGVLRACLINKDLARSARVRIDAGRRVAAGSVLRLTGPTVDVIAGVRLGGSAVDDFGGWAPAASETAQKDGEHFVADVPAASAALVSLSQF